MRKAPLLAKALPVEKDTDEITGETALGDRKNMVFSGSFVTYGRGRFLVTATGMDTEMGKIALLLKNTGGAEDPAAGQSGSVRQEALPHHSGDLCSAVCRQRAVAA